MIIEKIKIPGLDIHIYCDTSTGKNRPYVTPPHRKQVFNSIHSLNHPSARTTTKIICDQFMWPSIRKDCHLWCRSCIPCQRSKITRHVQSPLCDFALTSGRFSHIHVDIITLSISKSHSYCLTVVDRFTRWCEAQPMMDKTAEATTSALLQCWISRFGCPNKITVDRGKQFISFLFKDIAQRFGISIVYSSSYHPKSNGMVENVHRPLKSALMAQDLQNRLNSTILAQGNNWYETLPLVLLGIRSSFKEDLQSSSAELVYGEALRLPGEFFTPDKNPSSDATSFLSRLTTITNALSPSPASRHSKPKVYVYKELSNCSHAFLLEPPIRSSLQPPYSGPYKILKRQNKTIVLNIKGQPTTVSID